MKVGEKVKKAQNKVEITTQKKTHVIQEEYPTSVPFCVEQILHVITLGPSREAPGLVSVPCLDLQIFYYLHGTRVA